MLTKPVNRLSDDVIRNLAMFVAGTLLNYGLFFILALFAPLVVGIIIAYILGHRRNGILAGVLSAVFSYSVIFAVAGFATDLIVFSTSVLIMAFIAGVGGVIGSFLQKRMRESAGQVSTTILPGE
ncbi:MAG: hypothetical protein ACTSWA_10315 [Candidatus Thorarchaeota archaeon]